MKDKIIFGVAIGILLWLGCVVFSSAEYKTPEEEAKAYNVTRVTKTVEGLKFSVQDDRPIEKVAGVYRPLDMDAYVALKFNKLEKQVDDLSARLKKIDELFGKVEALEKRMDALQKKTDVLSLKEQEDAGNETRPKP